MGRGRVPSVGVLLSRGCFCPVDESRIDVGSIGVRQVEALPPTAGPNLPTAELNLLRLRFRVTWRQNAIT